MAIAVTGTRILRPYGARPGGPDLFRETAPLDRTRGMPPALVAAMQDKVLQLCLLVRIDRSDGASLGFTTHDFDVAFGGLTYEAESAVQSTNIRQELGGSPDNVDVTGVVSSTRVSDEDLRAGRYDSAQVTVRLADWSNPSLGAVVLMRGNIGDVSVGDGYYTASFRSLMQRFQQQVGELYSPTCRVFQLGDARCKFNLAGVTADGNPAVSTVSAATVLDQVTLLVSGGVGAVGYYNYGTLKSTSGRNAGVVREVKLHGSGALLASVTLTPVSGVPSGNLPFRRSYDYSASLTLAFHVPAGTWDMGALMVASSWSIVNPANPGTDQLTVQLPPGQANDLVLRENSANTASYSDSRQLGDETMAAVNLAAGGTISLAVRHTQPSSENRHTFNVTVPSATLELVGPGGGTSNRLVLHEGFPFPVSPGDTFEATAGCNRLPGTCSQKFANIVNFRGEPNLPGTEKLLQVGRPPQ